MFERFRRGGAATAEPEERRDREVEGRREREPEGRREREPEGRREREPEGRRDREVEGRRDTEPTRERGAAVAAGTEAQDRFGGINWGAAFFGWLVAVGLGTLLIALISAAGAAIGLTSVSGSQAKSSAGTIGIVGGALLVVALVIAYYAGGYVAGRMSRFDGGRQGFATWLLGLIVTLLLAAAGAIFGDQYNLFAQLKLPRVPVDEGSLATGGAIALAAVLVGTLIAAIAGGSVGRRYHRRVDRAIASDVETDAGRR